MFNKKRAHPKGWDKSKLVSRYVTVGDKSAPHRAMLRAMGLGDADIAKPLVGVATCWNEAAPCNIKLSEQAQYAKQGVKTAGATPRVVECLLWGLGWQQAIADLSDRLEGHARIALTEAAALWVSHLDDRELATLRTGLPDIALYPRIGTRLWHGDRGALSARGTVLAVHDVARGQASGYMQRRAPRGGTVVVVGGGTSHGVALEAPSNAMNLHQRGIAAATGLLASAGQALSPFVIGGKHRWFADPPHMHVSLVRVPEGVALPQVGDEVEVTVRFATVNPDRILGLD